MNLVGRYGVGSATSEGGVLANGLRLTVCGGEWDESAPSIWTIVLWNCSSSSGFVMYPSIPESSHLERLAPKTSAVRATIFSLVNPLGLLTVGTAGRTPSSPLASKVRILSVASKLKMSDSSQTKLRVNSLGCNWQDEVTRADPSISGIWMSMKTVSKSQVVFSLLIALWPPSTATTAAPYRSSIRFATRRLTILSSTTWEPAHKNWSLRRTWGTHKRTTMEQKLPRSVGL